MRIRSAFFSGLRRAALAACALSLAVLAAGCGNTKLTTFTWEVEAVPSNLDPQTARGSGDIIAVTHLYSGLYRLDEQGRPQPDCAESCTVSPDGLTYTFTLKEDLAYLGYRNKDCGSPLTSDDFLFGLQRVFLPETGSPYVLALGNIENGLAVAEGRLSPDRLGVSAPDERTLVIRLERPDDGFAAKLCLPGAMPCNRAYFEASEGSYGLRSSTTMGNGPFYLYNWTDSGLFLRRPARGDCINNLRLVPEDDAEETEAASSGKEKEPLTPRQKVENGKVSAALSDEPASGELAQLPFTDTTWVLLYNTREKGLDSALVRQGLTACAAHTELDPQPPLSPAQGLIPPQAAVNGQNYRESAGPVLFESSDALALYKAGLAECGLEKLSGMGVLVPQGPAAQLFGPINQQWQKELSAFFTVEELPEEELLRRVDKGDFHIALLPLAPTDGDPLSLLTPRGKPGGWQDAEYEAACLREAENFDLQGRAQRLARLEQQLIGACPFAPLFHETRYLLLDPGVKGLVFDPFGPLLDVTGAVKK